MLSSFILLTKSVKRITRFTKVSMQLNKVVVQFQDGALMKGETSDFFPNKKSFHLQLLDGNMVDINVEKLKAVFFVKDFEGNKDYKKQYTDVIPGGGKKIKIQFTDGESLIGYTQGYTPNRPVFFVIPADKQSNNQRIFIISSAVKKIEFV